jgi:urease accessory protein
MPELRARAGGAVTLGLGLVLALGIGLFPAAAEAHTALQGVGSFWSGVAHLLSSLDQLGLIVGLAIWTRFHQPRLDSQVIATVFGAVFLGVPLGTVVHVGARLEATAGLPALMIAVGIAGAVRLDLGARALLCMASAGGVVLGASAADGADGLSLALFSLGTSVAGASVLSYALLGARGIEVEWGRIAMRAGASWIAAVGLMVLALHLVGNRGRT